LRDSTSRTSRIRFPTGTGAIVGAIPLSVITNNANNPDFKNLVTIHVSPPRLAGWRYRNKADINQSAIHAQLVENDPERTSGWKMKNREKTIRPDLVLSYSTHGRRREASAEIMSVLLLSL